MLFCNVENKPINIIILHCLEHANVWSVSGSCIKYTDSIDNVILRDVTKTMREINFDKSYIF